MPDKPIIGYHSYEKVLRVHLEGCPSLLKVAPERLVHLNWADILADDLFRPEKDYETLDPLDFRVLQHHREYGIDYTLVVARAVGMTKQQAFDCHHKLRELGLLQRVNARIVQYRKGIAEHKWIKHRNHTYYEITDKGQKYLDYHLSRRC
ncbi:MAG: DUF2250 domain-containing protein [Candidatus Zixiibacteriota bacterium]|nr:MAG: DUF2250 domain-containing protein [candidate division Zixibacteria bacterium]